MTIPFSNWIKKHQLISFFVLFYSVMNGVLFGYILLRPGQPLQPWSLVWAFGIFSPTICTLSGIGRVAAQNAWTHPLAILASIIGVAILVITLAVFAGWKLPLIHGDQQALIAIAILIGAKIVDSLVHYLLARSL